MATPVIGEEAELPSPTLLKRLNQKTPSSGSLCLSEASKWTDETTATTSSSTAFSAVDPLITASLSDEEEVLDDNEICFPYAPTALESAQTALAALQSRLRERNCHDLRLESMKESFDLEILTQFYNELMIPNFPLEEERDDLEDWLLYLDPAQQADDQGGPSMDVLILRDYSKDNNDNNHNTIIGGIAFEYYPEAHAGLLSYMVVNTDFRRLGILATLHPVFCEALQALHEHTSRTNTPIRAILAETNTATAGDVPPAVARKRHEILFRLGYRLLEFPYVQPPLATDVDSFDEIMLLLYVGTTQSLENEEEGDSQRSSSSSSIETQVLYDYVLDFYHSVFGYESLDFQDHWYYRLVTWYAKKHANTKISPNLPWEDVTLDMKAAMAKETGSSS